jgi:hypothetical protein
MIKLGPIPTYLYVSPDWFLFDHEPLVRDWWNTDGEIRGASTKEFRREPESEPGRQSPGDQRSKTMSNQIPWHAIAEIIDYMKYDEENDYYGQGSHYLYGSIEAVAKWLSENGYSVESYRDSDAVEETTQPNG